MIRRDQLGGGAPAPLGATWDGHGVNFAVFSQHATEVEICIFDEEGRDERSRLRLSQRHNGVFYGYLEGARPGLLYGLRVYGPYDPHRGHRFNHHKLLIDPYARRLFGELTWDDALFGYIVGESDLSFDTRDSAPFMPKCMVTAPLSRELATPYNPLGGVAPQALSRRPLTEGLIYEGHTRGLTMRHPEVPRAHRGTLSGLASDALITHLQELSVSALELLPIQYFSNDRYLVEKGLSNYWGYQPLSYFACATHYLSDPQLTSLDELRSVTSRLAEADIELWIDVVYNHTGEGNELGPTLSFKGIDNATYYSLHPDQPRYYLDDSGCGNRLNVTHPQVLQLVLDSLRYWHAEVGVSGFRFDLCTSLGRGPRGLDMRGPFFAAIAQDPQLAGARLIAEPWDVGPGGYQLGGYPSGWSEWNDRYRDTLRRFWRGDQGLRPKLARRLCGSSALFKPQGRLPSASVNYLCSHDGVTLHDLVTYAQKHNYANGEENRDGHHDDLNIHFGVDGEDEGLGPLRRRVQRSLLACLFLSRGAPMLLAGDELGRTQKGNNNAYCQDNELSWLDWSDLGRDEELLDFTRGLMQWRRESSLLHQDRWFTGERASGSSARDLIWLVASGAERAHDAWEDGDGRDLSYALCGEREALWVVMNASDEARIFHLPERLDDLKIDAQWERVIDTSSARPEARSLSHHQPVKVDSKSVQVWRWVS